MDEAILQKAEQIIGYHFNDQALLVRALTHASSIDTRLKSNERLEFLGDAVLSLVICEALFEQFSRYLEGDLTKIKSMLVSRGTCARLAKEQKLHKLLLVGKGMQSSRALAGSLAAGVMESVIGALYQDGGLEPARQFILKLFGPLIEKADAQQTQGNFKSVLQQYAQDQFGTTPVYMLLDEKGPDHDKAFELAVTINQKHFPSAWGTNKKEAEQRAAHNALIELGVLEPKDK